MSSDGLHVVVAPRPARWAIAVLAVWIACVLTMIAFAVTGGAEGGALPPMILLVAFLALGAGALAWLLAGREEIVVRDGALEHAYRLGRLRRARRFERARVDGLRVTDETTSLLDPRHVWNFYGIGGGPIAFEDGVRTHRLGSGLDDDEARKLVRRISKALR